MGKKKGSSGKKKTESAGSGMIWVDPSMIRFQHSRIRPYFSSCGRALADTLDMIRKGEISASDLPPIQVLVGPETNDGRWYFSLNNRRLWVLKRCREENLLTDDNKILVRIRQPKSEAEANRYTLANCAVEAKLMRESRPQQNAPQSTNGTKAPQVEDNQTITGDGGGGEDCKDDST